MSHATQVAELKRIIESEQRPIGDRAEALVAEIRRKHAGVEKALLFYGSSLRAGESSGKMLDFYVLVDSYRDVHGLGLKQLGSFLAPPSVHYCEADGPDGERLRSKYSIVSLSAFRRRARGGAFESMLWARFAQPTLLICPDPDLRKDLLETLAQASHHFLRETAPAIEGRAFQDCDLGTRTYGELQNRTSTGRRVGPIKANRGQTCGALRTTRVSCFSVWRHSYNHRAARYRLVAAQFMPSALVWTPSGGQTHGGISGHEGILHVRCRARLCPGEDQIA